MIIFTSILGVPVHYDRDSRADYGTKGRPIKSGGPVEPSFYVALERWVGALGQVCPWGLPEVIVTGGVRGSKPPPGKVSRHWQGRAIDIDAIYWEGKPPLVTMKAETTPMLYLAVEATIRRFFGTVLDFWYDGAHRDHWHIDDGHHVGWSRTRSHAVFLQSALNHVWGVDPLLSVDGDAGAKTIAAFREIAGTPSVDAEWGRFLDETARRGFSAVCG